MRLRKRIFTLLSLFVAGVMALGIVVSLNAKTTGNPNASQETQDIADTIVQSSGVCLFVCAGLPLLLVFLFMAWRNAVGLRTETYHHEQLDAINRSR
jgi:hypothetical protein